MIDDRPDKLQRTKLKQDIETAYLDATKVSNLLRNIVMCRCNGAKDAQYKRFVTYFGYLFDISSYKKGLDVKLVSECEKWFMTPRSTASTKNIVYGLKLYKRYIKELFSQKLLTYD